jgi:hypothetical protein
LGFINSFVGFGNKPAITYFRLVPCISNNFSSFATLKNEQIMENKGNMLYHNNNGNDRYLCWTEDNRLQGFMDNSHSAYYTYDASVNAILK